MKIFLGFTHWDFFSPWANTIIRKYPLLYELVNWATALYIFLRARTISIVFANTLVIILHCLRAFFGFWYTAGQLMLL